MANKENEPPQRKKRRLSLSLKATCVLSVLSSVSKNDDNPKKGGNTCLSLFSTDEFFTMYSKCVSRTSRI